VPQPAAQVNVLHWNSAICQMTTFAIGCHVNAGVTGACCDGRKAPGCDALVTSVGEVAQLSCVAGSKPMCCPTGKGVKTSG
jgi:hypothetical protein